MGGRRVPLYSDTVVLQWQCAGFYSMLLTLSRDMVYYIIQLRYIGVHWIAAQLSRGVIRAEREIVFAEHVRCSTGR